jgi:hypothetical protein
MLLYNTIVLAGNGTTDVLLVVYAKFLLALNERNKAHMNLVILFKSFFKKKLTSLVAHYIKCHVLSKF